MRRQNFPEPPILIGHSMGGLLAQQLAARIQPFALVLLTPAWPSGIWGLRWTNFVSFFRIIMRWAWWRRPQKLSFHRAVVSAFNGVPREKHVKLYHAWVEESGRAAFEIALWQLDRARASRVDPAAVRCPVYVVSCGNDRRARTAALARLAARRLDVARPQRHFLCHFLVDLQELGSADVVSHANRLGLVPELLDARPHLAINAKLQILDATKHGG